MPEELTKQMTMKKVDLSRQITNSEMLVSPRFAESLACMIPESMSYDLPESEDQMRMFFNEESGSYKPYRQDGSTAVISITGLLMHRFNWQYSDITGYSYIRRAFDEALADDSVSRILFDISSSGGSAAGAFDLADHIYENRNKKPMVAILDEYAFSAGYLLAAAIGNIRVPRTGASGSIGVVTMHVDWSKYMANAGITVKFIFAGDHKVDGNPYEELPKDVEERIQSRVNNSYELFVSAVAKYRGLDTDVIRGTQAEIYGADESLSLGLVDAVEPVSQAYTAFVTDDNQDNKEGFDMTVKDKGRDSATAEHSASANAEADNIDIEKVKADAYADGQKAERQRYSDVMSSDNFQGREKLAFKMLATTDMTSDTIADLLGEASVEQKIETKSGNSFDEAMSNTENPEVGGQDSTDDDNMSVGNQLFANFASVTGYKSAN